MIFKTFGVGMDIGMLFRGGFTVGELEEVITKERREVGDER